MFAIFRNTKNILALITTQFSSTCTKAKLDSLKVKLPKSASYNAATKTLRFSYHIFKKAVVEYNDLYKINLSILTCPS